MTTPDGLTAESIVDDQMREWDRVGIDLQEPDRRDVLLGLARRIEAAAVARFLKDEPSTTCLRCGHVTTFPAGASLADMERMGDDHEPDCPSARHVRETGCEGLREALARVEPVLNAGIEAHVATDEHGLDDPVQRWWMDEAVPLIYAARAAIEGRP